jgi:hypothetical protein
MPKSNDEYNIHKRSGSIHFDPSFSITAIDRHAFGILNRCDPGIDMDIKCQNLIDIFPEFVGHEDKIRMIVEKGEGRLRLDYVNRITPTKDTVYLHLTIRPFKHPSGGILLLKDVSAAARAKMIDHQKVNERNLLILALKRAKHDRDHAARIMGISREQLDRRIKSYHLG